MAGVDECPYPAIQMLPGTTEGCVDWLSSHRSRVTRLEALAGITHLAIRGRIEWGHLFFCLGATWDRKRLRPVAELTQKWGTGPEVLVSVT